LPEQKLENLLGEALQQRKTSMKLHQSRFFGDCGNRSGAYGGSCAPAVTDHTCGRLGDDAELAPHASIRGCSSYVPASRGRRARTFLSKPDILAQHLGNPFPSLPLNQELQVWTEGHLIHYPRRTYCGLWDVVANAFQTQNHRERSGTSRSLSFFTFDLLSRLALGFGKL
jgi:hypothetical protein